MINYKCVFKKYISIFPLWKSNDFFYLAKEYNIENRVQIRPILYPSHPIRLQIFFCVSDKILL